jgi:archaellum component FlaD/FlaE
MFFIISEKKSDPKNIVKLVIFLLILKFLLMSIAVGVKIPLRVIAYVYRTGWSAENSIRV